MDLHDDIRGRSPIQFLTATTGLNLSTAAKPSFAKVIARYVFLVNLLMGASLLALAKSIYSSADVECDF